MEDLVKMSGVAGVHSLHIWSLTMDRNVISVHLNVGQCSVTVHVSNHCVICLPGHGQGYN